MTVPQTGAWAPSHIVFHSQGPGDRVGRGRDTREGVGGPGGRVFQSMGSVETTTPINAFFQSLCLQVSMSLRIWVHGGQRVIGGTSPASFLPSPEVAFLHHMERSWLCGDSSGREDRTCSLRMIETIWNGE